MTSTPSSALASVLVVVEAALHNLDTFRRGEIRVMAENGIDTSEIHWLEWEVTGYEEARWTIEAPEATIQTILNAGWQQATV